MFKIKGSSLFFTFARDEFDSHEYWDNLIKIVDARFIDFGHMEEMEVGERDEGFIYGLSEAIRLLQEIKDSSNEVNNVILNDNKNGE